MSLSALRKTLHRITSNAEPPVNDALIKENEALKAQLGALRINTPNPREDMPDSVWDTHPGIFLVTLPKSGTVYVSHTLAQSLAYDHRNNVITPTFPKNMVSHKMLLDFKKGRMVSVSHMQPDQYNLKWLREMGVTKGVLHLRDPRAALASWFHFLPSRNAYLKTTYLDGRSQTEQTDWVIDRYYADFVGWTLGWLDVIAREPEQWDFLIITHDELLRDEAAYFKRIFDFHGITTATLKTVERNSGTHFRKGDNDDWRTLFNVEQTKRLNEKLPPELMERFDWQY